MGNIEAGTGDFPVPVPVSRFHAAQWYAEVWGWHLFPLNGKVPPRGFKWPEQATSDVAQLTAWFDCEPAPNIGVDCAKSGIVVVDVDDLATLSMLWSLGYETPRTLTALTGGGGLHYYYQAPDWPLRNTAGRLPGVSDKLPGIDLRADGGYVVAPPSSHESGLGYEFMPRRWAAEPAPCPDWLRPIERRRRVAKVQSVVVSDGYVETALADESQAVARATKGARNDQLVRSAFSLGTLVADGSLSRSRVEDQLLAAALAAGLSEHEAWRTILSGLDSGAQHPRTLR